MLEIGTQAPDFELPDQNGTMQSLRPMMCGRRKRIMERFPWE